MGDEAEVVQCPFKSAVAFSSQEVHDIKGYSL